MDERNHNELQATNWDLFVFGLSAFSLLNYILEVLLSSQGRQVVIIIDLFLCAIFLGDFLHRLLNAPAKWGYMRHGGTLDLLGSLPGLRIFRLFRMIRTTSVLRRLGPRATWAGIRERKASGAIFLVIFLVILALELASIAVLAAERGAANANILTAQDALWWGYVTITTVGYGDFFPVTTWGHIVGVLLMTIGVGLFGTFAGFVSNSLLAPSKGSPRAPAPAAEPDLRSRLREIASLLDQHERDLEELRQKLHDALGQV